MIERDLFGEELVTEWEQEWQNMQEFNNYGMILKGEQNE